MKYVKNFDYFQKLSYDVSKPTTTGAVISVLTCACITLLLLYNIIDYFCPNIIKTPIIYQDHDNSKIDMHLNIKVNAPCSLLSVVQEDQNGNRNDNVYAHLQKSRVDRNNHIIETSQRFSLGSLEQVVEQIKEEEACIIRGFLQIEKVQGNVHISFHSVRMIMNVLLNRYPDMFEKLTLSHKLGYLKFGDTTNTAKILSKYGYNEHTSFYKEDMPDYKYSKKPNFDYFIKIIPFLFKEENGYQKDDIMAYQYSLSSQDRNINNNDEDLNLPVITLSYDFSFLTMQIILEKKSFLHFLTHICAIVGGVYFIFTILSRILISCFEANDK